MAIVASAACLPALLPSFEVGLLAMWLPLCILAVSVDMLWGENHIVSFGHGAFFAAGGYVAGLLLRGSAADTSGSNLSLIHGEAADQSHFDATICALAA